MEGYAFIDEKGTFTIKNPENYNYLYFPLAGNKGLKSCLTPNLGGDSKGDQNSFVSEPVSAENLHNNKATRNFWCHIEGKGSWSVTGASARQMAEKFTNDQDASEIRAGFMWHELKRSSLRYQLEASVTTFIPVMENAEIMLITIANTGQEEVTFTPTAALPIYGRSADNLRDHRHVTSLLHRIRTTDYAVLVTPTLCFDERGHHINQLTYFAAGAMGEGVKPLEFIPVAEEFLGEGGNYEAPLCVIENREGVKAGYHCEGYEAVGGIRFAKATLKPGESVCYQLLTGYGGKESEIEALLEQYTKRSMVLKELEAVKAYWRRNVDVDFHTSSPEFDRLMQWIGFQPTLRRIFGCSFLPHHDYGKGGRGWRDLWQDCLALLILNPSGTRQLLLDNFAGVRIDGTNATIIGSRPGEFTSDRNHITRVWMDHGVWPFLTLKLYLNQTGDLGILEEETIYFKDAQVMRGTQRDEIPSGDTLLRDSKGDVYYGTVLEHLLIQNLTACYEVGEHNIIRLRGADWNDALDMAPERGESVAFTNAYAGNLRELAAVLKEYGGVTGKNDIRLAREIELFLTETGDFKISALEKSERLKNYCSSCFHEVSGEKVSVSISSAAKILRNIADAMTGTIREQEWITDHLGHGWYNGYYDNNGRRVEGQFESGIRMMLTGQVFAVMAGTATDEQVAEIAKSADFYLYRQDIGGYRLNTDFGELKTDLGRMFGFAYGHKENGAVFSHMAVMYANALYQRGYAKEGYKALKALADQSLNFEKSRIYPGIPEYFNPKGRGMYHYLTGAASWYLLTVITQMFGIRGEYGDLLLEPKLLSGQFDRYHEAGVNLNFRGKKLRIIYRNQMEKSYGEYQIGSCDLNGIRIEARGQSLRIPSGLLEDLSDSKEHCIKVDLK